jgi:hypothetical protein
MEDDKNKDETERVLFEVLTKGTLCEHLLAEGFHSRQMSGEFPLYHVENMLRYGLNILNKPELEISTNHELPKEHIKAVASHFSRYVSDRRYPPQKIVDISDNRPELPGGLRYKVVDDIDGSTYSLTHNFHVADAFPYEGFKGLVKITLENKELPEDILKEYYEFLQSGPNKTNLP